MPNVTTNALKTAQKLAQDAAKKVAQEPLEILRDIPKQAFPVSNLDERGYAEGGGEEQIKKAQEEKALKEKDQIQSSRQLEALNREIMDIRRQALFNELMQKIKGRETVSLDAMAPLSYEQKEVLKAHMEAMGSMNTQKDEQKPLVEPSAKPSRRFFGVGQKGQVQKEQTHVERVQPPSG